MTLPNFFILGAARAATSSLYFYLREHPDIYMSPDKEPQFFGYCGTERQTRSKYPTLAAYARLFDGVRGETIVGEATPTYLALPQAASAIHEHCPRAKLLVSLRNPVDRAFSYYEMSRSKGRQRRQSFEEWMTGNDFWLRGGGYHTHLKTYIDLFGRQQLAIVLFEDVQTSAADVIVAVHRFLGVRELRPAREPMAYNRGGLPKSPFGALLYRATTHRQLNRMLRPLAPGSLRKAIHAVRNRAVAPGGMLPETRLKLTEFFRDDILRTQDLIGRDLGHWLGVGAALPAAGGVR